MKNRKKEIRLRSKWVKLLTILLALLVFPVYLISRLLFQTAIERDCKSILMDSDFMKLFLQRAKCWRHKRKEKRAVGQEAEGKGFVDFYEEVERGKQWFLEQKKERITITSEDDLRLVGYYLQTKEPSDKIIILMHGYRSDGYGDFSNLFQFYHEQGYHLLVPHQRSHGDSEGSYICFGVKERYDVSKWTEYIVDRFGEQCRIFLSGISMGGATVLMAAGLKLPKQVKGIIADCAFSSPFEIISHVLKVSYMLPKFPFLYVADLLCRNKAGFYMKEASALESMENNEIPVLFIHGDKDSFVPTDMTRKCYDACRAKKDILIVKGAAHGTSHLVDPVKYRKTVINFMEKNY